MNQIESAHIGICRKYIWNVAIISILMHFNHIIIIINTLIPKDTTGKLMEWNTIGARKNGNISNNKSHLIHIFMGVIGIHGRLNDPIALVLLYGCRLNKLLFVLSFVCARITNKMLTNGLCVCVVYFGDIKKTKTVKLKSIQLMCMFTV